MLAWAVAAVVLTDKAPTLITTRGLAPKGIGTGIARTQKCLSGRARGRGGAAGFGAPALVPTVAISKPETSRFAQFCAIESARHDVL